MKVISQPPDISTNNREGSSIKCKPLTSSNILSLLGMEHDSESSGSRISLPGLAGCGKYPRSR